MCKVIKLKYRFVLLGCCLLSFIFIVAINVVINAKQNGTNRTIETSKGIGLNEINQIDHNDQTNSLLFLSISEKNLPPNSPISNKTTSQNIIYKNFHLKRSITDRKKDRSKPWFMTNGTIWPQKSQNFRLSVWPEDLSRIELEQHSPISASTYDRIVNQLMYIPDDYDQNDFVPFGKRQLKKILLANGKHGWNDLLLGREQFVKDKCPVNACFLATDPRLMDRADVVLFKDRFVWPQNGRYSNMNQLWILFLLESPMNTQSFAKLPPNLFNLTATYRHDSDIVAPYEKYLPYNSIWPNDNDDDGDSGVSNRMFIDKQQRNYAEGKTKKIAWFVSNCNTKNKRMEYVRQLSKFIEVDIFGSCGRNKCPRNQSKRCFEMLDRDYKFYLAFENSNCRDYITEKFFVNALGLNDELNVIPIVLGANPEDYQRSAPPNSFIHVSNFESPSHLATYLHWLDRNDDVYNSFFDWKRSPKDGEFINTYFWCRLCTMIHAIESNPKPSGPSYQNIADWWSSSNICLKNGQYHWPFEQRSTENSFSFVI
ncbi:glycoprotein 3-alpha-L-fucosyltransferase A-like protein [Sarcoptes scabiei]|nr:glycoprotein 3-alpha-L-fucosyltransferase A-like protein [Sarcoptes scabiei]